jgi:hypothetical protein
MKIKLCMPCLCLCASAVLADDAAPPSAPGITAVAVAAEADPDGARFSTDAKWDTAGYNNNEIVYTILLTSHDTRILRCTTLLTGWYFENGKKLSISDRQSSTVFPDQQVQVGNWMGMDEQSGATYSVKCHPI